MRTTSPELPEETRAVAAKARLQVASSEAVETWPDLPVAIKNGIGVRVGDIAYVGLGSAGTGLYALDLENPSTGWVRKAAFIGPATNSAAATTVDNRIFVFSGNGKATPDAKSSVIFDSVYTYDPANDLWSRLDTRTPVGLSGAKALPLSDGRIAIVGGYNKDLFDRYLADLSALDKDENPVELARLVDGYMGMPPEDYKWNDSVLSYDPKANSWSFLGENPFLPNCDSAVAQTGRDTFLLVNGEIKPGLRTPSIKRVYFEGNVHRWQRLADLPTPDADDMQEGIAGAFAGCCGESVLVAGGVNFKGARASAATGKWYAHQGLVKKWRDEIYSFDGTEWREVGKLPRGLGYGMSFSVPEGLLVVGGEDCDGRARTEVFSVKLIGAGIVIES